MCLKKKFKTYFGDEKADGLCKICAKVDQRGENVEEKNLHDIDDKDGIMENEDDDNKDDDVDMLLLP